MTNKPQIIVPKFVNDALSKVKYPGSEQSLVALEMVQEIRIAGKKIDFSLVFQRSNDKNIPTVITMCKTTLAAAFGNDIEVNITPKALHNMERPVLPGVKNIIAVSSGKGGVGKSTVSTNLAVSLAQTGARVGIIDADIFGPSLPKMFGKEDAVPTGEKKDGIEMIFPIETHGVKMLSIGLFVGKDEALVWRGPMASNALKQLIMNGDWGELDYLLIDLPPGTSDIHLSLVQTVPVTGAIIVTTPQDVALADVVKGVNMFNSKSIDVPVLGLVENMAWFTPEELPENKYYIFGKDGGKKLAEQLDIPLLGEIPIVQSIREGGDEGKPVALEEYSPTGQAFMQLAANVIREVERRNAQKAPSQKVKTTKK
ncbi:MAG: Mrp/NBP35 family ATP-binding protein [Mangrovibacterium sp.]